jgi:hypothetical protein
MKKIKSIPLIILVLLYLFFSSVFNYSLYCLSMENNNHQFYMITIYFMGEIISFILFLLPFKQKIFLDYKAEPINMSPNNSNNNSSLSGDDSSLNIDDEFENNDSSEIDNERYFNFEHPFIGLKPISFLIPGLLDFFSKFLIINGINILNTDSLFRPVFCLLFTIIFSKILLKINIDKSTKIGYLLIIISLIILALYYQFFEQVHKLYLESNIIIGLSFFLVAELLSCFKNILQAKYFIIGDIHFFRIVAFEGLFGFILSVIILILAINLNCPLSIDNKYKNIFCNGKKIESDLFKTINDIKSNNKTKWALFYLSCPLFYSLFGALFSKYNGIMSRVSIEYCGICFWIVELAIINNNNFSLVSYILCFICIITSIVGMIMISEYGEYSINKGKLIKK